MDVSRMGGRRVKSLFRYPGSKDKMAPAVIGRMPMSVTYGIYSDRVSFYCEPFIGCGAIAVRVCRSLPTATRIVLGDMDPGVTALWESVLRAPAELCDRIDRFAPSVELYDEYKATDGQTDRDVVDRGFRKLALHQMSFSGLGAMSGGPIGGRDQRSDYNIHCRWNPTRHKADVWMQYRLFRRFDRPPEVHLADFSKTLGMVPPDGFAYLDPPYYAKGGELYKHNMADADHERLAALLRDARFDWLLSYDDHPRVRELYSWASIEHFEATYTIDVKRAKRRKNNELVITPRR